MAKTKTAATKKTYTVHYANGETREIANARTAVTEYGTYVEYNGKLVAWCVKPCDRDNNAKITNAASKLIRAKKGGRR